MPRPNKSHGIVVSGYDPKLCALAAIAIGQGVVSAKTALIMQNVAEICEGTGQRLHPCMDPPCRAPSWRLGPVGQVAGDDYRPLFRGGLVKR